MDVFKNLARAVVAQGYDDAATSIDLASGEGARLPATACTLLWWNATDHPDPVDDPNAEYVRKDPHVGDTLTITRAQEGTAATVKNVASKTYKVMQAITASQLALLLEAAAAWSADNRLLRSNGTGRAVQDSPVTLDDLGNLAGLENVNAGSANVGALRFTAGAAPAAPPASTVQPYATTDKLLRVKDEDGLERLMSGGHVDTVDATGAPHTLALANVGKLVEVDADVTVPANATAAIPVGSLFLVQRVGVAAVTITPEGGVTIEPSGGPWSIASQHAVIALRKRATDTWTVLGEYA